MAHLGEGSVRVSVTLRRAGSLLFSGGRGDGDAGGWEAGEDRQGRFGHISQGHVVRLEGPQARAEALQIRLILTARRPLTS